jgi:hypothetical protein
VTMNRVLNVKICSSLVIPILDPFYFILYVLFFCYNFIFLYSSICLQREGNEKKNNANICEREYDKIQIFKIIYAL